MIELAPEEARELLVGHHGLRAPFAKSGAAGVRGLLQQLRCIQLDPLDVLGTNADLVALARVDGIARGDVYRHLLPGHAFEHFAKERCLLPASALPYYRDAARGAHWWRFTERHRRLAPEIIEKVLHEVHERGPVTAAGLTHHGQVERLDWHGWKGTGRATTMALEVLWADCRVVVCGRSGRGKLWDVPERALPKVARLPSGDFQRWGVLERAEAAGMLSRSGGATWSMLREARDNKVPDQLVAEGLLEEVKLPGSSRSWFLPAGLRKRRFPRDDGRMRILGPLDPLLWDRELVRQAFGFDYVWEVYKPAHLRKWGWYVVPLLQHGQLVGRMEAVIEDGALVVRKLWPEKGRKLDRDALAEALERHARACGAERVKLRASRARP